MSIVVPKDEEPENSLFAAPIMQGMKKYILVSYVMIGKVPD